MSCSVAFSIYNLQVSSITTHNYYYYERGEEWHCMTARSCSARAGVKRIYMRIPDSRTKASTCFAAAVLRRISGVKKCIPRSSTACFRRRRASENLGQTSIKCSTVSGISHWSQSPSGWRPIRDIWWYGVAVTCAQTKDYSREGVGRQRGPQQGRKDNNFVCISSYDGLVLNFPRVERVLVQRWQHISKIQSGIYPFVVNTFGWIGWWFGSGEFCQLLSNFISWDVCCPEPKGNGPRIPMLRVWNRGQFYLRNYAFSSTSLWTTVMS